MDYYIYCSEILAPDILKFTITKEKQQSSSSLSSSSSSSNKKNGFSQKPFSWSIPLIFVISTFPSFTVRKNTFS
jgi:hypothetical protein